MKIIVCGAGHVGSHAAEVLSRDTNDVTVIDLDHERLERVAETMDVGTLEGNCANAEVLREAGVADADALVAGTNKDEVNLLTASIAKGLGCRRSIARVHHGYYFQQRGLDYQDHLSIDQLFCPEHSTAMHIADTLCNPGALRVENFARGRIEMQEFAVNEGAPAVGKPLSEVSLPRGTRLAAITRDHEAFLPEASTVMQSGDVVILVGNTLVFQEGRKLFHADGSNRQRLVILGGSALAVWLCRALRGRDVSVRLFETDRERAEDLAQKLDWVTIIQADPTDPTVCEEEHIAAADAFVAAGDDEKQAILGCAWAKSLGVDQVMAVAQRPNYHHLLNHVGIDRVFSPRMVAAQEIAVGLGQGPLRRMASLAEGVIDVYQVEVGKRAEVHGKPLHEVNLSPDWMVAAVQHKDKVKVPSADDSMLAGDIVLVVGRHGMEKKLKKIFGKK